MPTLITKRLAAACGLALILVLSTAAAASAKKVEADLRVVGKANKVLAETTMKTGPTKIPTSKKATCFGKGTGGSGKKYGTKGPTALGFLSQAAVSIKALKPLLVTDTFVDEFGLGICGVGHSKSSSKLSWYLKVNHKNPNIGGEKAKVRKGDEVLWALAGFPYPNELALEGPGEATPGVPFEVRVFSYDDKGKRKPASGVTVTGASAPTGPDGRTQASVLAPQLIRATHGKDIPSNGVSVCVAGACP
jgi:hypothetical protein